MVRLGARSYDSRRGRFVSRDPHGLAAGPNLYTYGHANPLRWTDRWGLSSRPVSRTPADSALEIPGEIIPFTTANEVIEHFLQNHRYAIPGVPANVSAWDLDSTEKARVIAAAIEETQALISRIKRWNVRKPAGHRPPSEDWISSLERGLDLLEFYETVSVAGSVLGFLDRQSRLGLEALGLDRTTAEWVSASTRAS